MPHPEVHNHSRLAHEWLILSDEEGVPQCVTLVQATFRIPDDGDLVLLDDQPSLKLEGEWYGDPASSSLRIEPQTAFMKPATDVILHGRAYAASPQTAEVLVGIRIGSLSKVARVVGDRFLVRRGGTQRIAGLRRSRPSRWSTSGHSGAGTGVSLMRCSIAASRGTRSASDTEPTRWHQMTRCRCRTSSCRAIRFVSPAMRRRRPDSDSSHHIGSRVRHSPEPMTRRGCAAEAPFFPAISTAASSTRHPRG